MSSADLSSTSAQLNGQRDSDPLQLGQRSEFTMAVTKFATHISHAVRQVTGGSVRLTVPTLDGYLPQGVSLKQPFPDTLVQKLARDSALLDELEQHMQQWSNTILQLLNNETSARAAHDSEGPLGEIYFWRDRSAALSSLYEQLSAPDIANVMRVLQAAALPHWDQFNSLVHCSLIALFFASLFCS